MEEIHVTTVGGNREDGVLTIGLSDGEQHLILMLDLHPTPQDIALGQDGICLEWNDQGSGGYKLIRTAQWVDGSLTLTFVPEAQASGVPAAIVLRDVADLLDAELRRILDEILARV